MKSSYIQTLNCSGCPCNTSSFSGSPSKTYGPDGLLNFYGQHYNAGGYGFWCNKECAARKDAKRALKETTAATEAERSDSLIETVKAAVSSTPGQSGGGSTMMYVGIAVGVILIGSLAFFILRKK